MPKPKRASLDLDQFKIDLPKPSRDPLDSIIPTTPPTASTRSEPKNVRSSARAPVRTPLSRPIHRTSRIRIRHPFNIFADQLEALQQIQLEKVTAGKKKPTLAKMVTQALDEYLERQWKKLPKSLT